MLPYEQASPPITPRPVTLAGRRFVCLTAGDPTHPPILMIHGWAHHPGIWRSTIAALSDRYYCVAVGVLGCGDSDKPPDGDYSIAGHGRDTLQIADALDIGRFSLLGQSRGGQIALCIAAQLAPDRISQLGDISGVASGRIGGYLRYVYGTGICLGAALPGVFRLLRGLWARDPVARWLYGPYFYDGRRQPAGMARRDGAYAFAEGTRLTHWRALQTMVATNLLPVLHQVQAPTLVLFGQQDLIVPPSEGRAAAERIPHARLVLLERCGHYPMVDQPTAYLLALEEFLATAG
ncbi:MAG TPA: alpha/beta hydrolase [Anaerolineae bacterium]|nr:alpha/beta hydrolase [Anaerolineae bacterium]